MSLRNPGCAFCGMPPLDGERCCTSDFQRATMRKADAELADLRAYKERTEAGLVDLSGAVTLNNRTPDDGSHHAFLLNTITWKMRRNGLWRDPPQAEVQP